MKQLLLNYLYNVGQEAGKKRETNLLSLVEWKPGAVYLDCGPADGELTIKVAKKIGTNNIYGIDRDSVYVIKAKKKGIEVKRGDLNKRFPFKDQMFDVITGIEVIEHLYDTDIFLREIYRVLKRDGYAIIGTENLASWHNIVALTLGQQPSTGPHISDYYPVGFHPLCQKQTRGVKKGKKWNTDKHINVATRKALLKLFNYHGFKIDAEKPSGFYPFGGMLSDILAQLDRSHALTILVKLRKR